MRERQGQRTESDSNNFQNKVKEIGKSKELPYQLQRSYEHAKGENSR